MPTQLDIYDCIGIAAAEERQRFSAHDGEPLEDSRGTLKSMAFAFRYSAHTPATRYQHYLVSGSHLDYPEWAAAQRQNEHTFDLEPQDPSVPEPSEVPEPPDVPQAPCTCGAKTNQREHHRHDCPYREGCDTCGGVKKVLDGTTYCYCNQPRPPVSDMVANLGPNEPDEPDFKVGDTVRWSKALRVYEGTVESTTGFAGLEDHLTVSVLPKYSAITPLYPPRKIVHRIPNERVFAGRTGLLRIGDKVALLDEEGKAEDDWTGTILHWDLEDSNGDVRAEVAWDGKDYQSDPLVADLVAVGVPGVPTSRHKAMESLQAAVHEWRRGAGSGYPREDREAAAKAALEALDNARRIR